MSKENYNAVIITSLFLTMVWTLLYYLYNNSANSGTIIEQLVNMILPLIIVTIIVFCVEIFFGVFSKIPKLYQKGMLIAAILIFLFLIVGQIIFTRI